MGGGGGWGVVTLVLAVSRTLEVIDYLRSSCVRKAPGFGYTCRPYIAVCSRLGHQHTKAPWMHIQEKEAGCNYLPKLVQAIILS